MTHFYLAYGMNTNLDSMQLRCPDARVLGPALLQDYELEFAYHCNIQPAAGKELSGLLWQISSQDLQSLDWTEGYPDYYNRIQVPVLYKNQKIQSWVYVMNGPTVPSPPSAHYWDMVLYGYTQNKINQKYLMSALNKCYEENTFI